MSSNFDKTDWEGFVDDLPKVGSEPLSTRPLRCTDVARFEAMERVIEAAAAYLAWVDQSPMYPEGWTPSHGSELDGLRSAVGAAK